MNPDKLKEWLASRKRERAHRNADELFDLLRKGDRIALSAAITMLESTLTEDQKNASELIQKCLPFAGSSIRIGITGVPGVGKSTFIEQFGQTVLEKRSKLAVLAIDPSSEKSGGSILGDKTRMEQLSQIDRVFIRPSAAGTTLGGVARKTRETIILCEAAGFDTILIETVDVGQSEIMVHSMVDFFLLLLLAGAGDELQGIKRGIMEMADGLVVTKADGENEKRAAFAVREIKNAIHLFPPSSNGWIPEVKTCSSLLNKGVNEVFAMIEKFEQHTKINGSFETKRKDQDTYWMHEMLKVLLFNGLEQNNQIQEMMGVMVNMVRSGSISPFEGAEQIYTNYLKLK